MIALSDYVPPTVTQCTRQTIAQAPFTVVPEALVYAILAKEGGKPGVISKPNSDGSVDLGRAQVNSGNIPGLQKKDNRFSWKTILHDECTNLRAGITILHDFYVAVGYDWPRAIRAYNVGFKSKGGYQYTQTVLGYWRWFDTLLGNSISTVAGEASASQSGLKLGIPGFGEAKKGNWNGW